MSQHNGTVGGWMEFNNWGAGIEGPETSLFLLSLSPTSVTSFTFCRLRVSRVARILSRSLLPHTHSTFGPSAPFTCKDIDKTISRERVYVPNKNTGSIFHALYVILKHLTKCPADIGFLQFLSRKRKEKESKRSSESNATGTELFVVAGDNWGKVNP